MATHTARPSPYIPMRHLVGFIVPITPTIRPFLARGTSNPDELEAIHQAWFTAVTLAVALWARPYDPELW